MLKPLTIMAHVLLLLIVSVQAQPALENAKKTLFSWFKSAISKI